MTTDNIILIINICLTAICAALALTPAYYKMKAERKKEGADAAAALTQSAMAIAKHCEEQIEDLKIDVARLERQLRYWQKGAMMLIEQLVKHDLEPVWDPNGGPKGDEE